MKKKENENIQQNKNYLLTKKKKMSDKVYPVQITYKSRTWDYTDAQATGLRACSDLVSAEVDTRVESDEDNMEPICIPIADGDYTEDHVNDCLEYYSKNEWKPAMYGKVVSNTVADIVQDQAGQDLCTKYGVEEMNNLYKVATYLQMKNLQNLALIRLGVEVYCRPDDLNAFNELQTKLSIQEAFNLDMQNVMLKKYAFIKSE